MDSADETNIQGATGSTYIVTDGDVGKAIKVRANFTDDAGNAESLTSEPTDTVGSAEDLQLQSATVDGATLTLTYNETLDTGVSLPSSAFSVNVDGVSVSIVGVGVGESSVLLLLSPAVAAGDAVTVDYTAPDGTDVIKDTGGRRAPSFSGLEVTNDTAAQEQSGSRSQPPGVPRNLAVAPHESGKLRASWDAPESGPSPTGYTVQWKDSGDDWADRANVSEADVKGTSHVITGLTDGVEYAVRVIASTNDTDGDPSGEVVATPQETAPPQLSSTSVDGAALTLAFNEPLDTGQVPEEAAFAVTVAGVNRSVDTLSVSGSAVTVTLVTAVFSGDTVTVDYTAPAGESAAGL